MLALLAAGVLAAPALAAAPAHAPTARTAPAVASASATPLGAEPPGGALFPSPAQLTAARRFAGGRTGRVAFAVAGADGRIRGLHLRRRHPSASVVKAMLLVAYLRRIASTGVSPGARAQLGPMIRRSDNAAALRVYGAVGRRGLRAVGRAAGMLDLSTATSLFDTPITAADQARFFVRIDGLVPSRHRRYARSLLRTVVARQRWGVPRAARGRWTVLLKGGWRRDLVHQAALVEFGRARAGIAVLTTGNPSVAYGQRTIEGVAARLLAPRFGGAALPGVVIEPGG